jgi:hypothetical protein
MQSIRETRTRDVYRIQVAFSVSILVGQTIQPPTSFRPCDSFTDCKAGRIVRCVFDLTGSDRSIVTISLQWRSGDLSIELATKTDLSSAAFPLSCGHWEEHAQSCVS